MRQSLDCAKRNKTKNTNNASVSSKNERGGRTINKRVKTEILKQLQIDRMFALRVSLLNVTVQFGTQDSVHTNLTHGTKL